MNRLHVAIGLLGMLFMLAFSSCSDSPEPSPSKRAKCVELSCRVEPRSKSRAMDENGFWGDGSEATHLFYMLYKDGELFEMTEAPGATEAIYLGDGQFKLSLNITEDADWDIFLWSTDEGYGSYTYDLDDPTIIGWCGDANMNDADDMFLTYGKLYDKAKKELTTNFTLKRPLCQVNIVTDEFNGIMDEKDNVDKLSGYWAGFAFRDTNDGDNVEPIEYDFTTKTVAFYHDYPSNREFYKNPYFEPCVTIDGRKMAYLYTKYFFAPEDGIIDSKYKPFLFLRKPAPSKEELVYLDLGDNFKANSRLFIYPKKGSVFFPSEFEGGEVRVGIQVVPGFTDTSVQPVSRNN